MQGWSRIPFGIPKFVLTDGVGLCRYFDTATDGQGGSHDFPRPRQYPMALLSAERELVVLTTALPG